MLMPLLDATRLNNHPFEIDTRPGNNTLVRLLNPRT